ncbi:MAG: adenosylcobalamin-dependent ribonucleoside-diphosphate reductase [Phycisphaeraceae bacterium]|nr:adenosylcobalamin-dependent ribonucleoside-diphosphate reductase [Phycisphaeraceae bacterium]
MKITRKFTTAGTDPFDTVEWVTRSTRIANPDGRVVFEMNDACVPSSWSQLATDIMVSKYFRKAGAPQLDDRGEPVRDDEGRVVTGPEKSARQVIHRLADCWRHWGEEHGYFDSKQDAQAFYDEIAYMMLHQVAAPNSPQWFNTGLHRAYGLTGPAQGHYIADHKTGAVSPAPDAYTHPQPHACFIQHVEDTLVGEGGIMDLWMREARLFKYGSGTGTNFSALRAENEPLSGGGKSSGLMSWLKIGDRAAGAIKSGGTTRRAAKMVCLDLDHPDIRTFVNWKVREEIKVAALVEGMKHLSPEQRKDAERLGLKLDYDFNGEAYQTVSGQNANNSIRIPDSFFDALDEGKSWALKRRTDDEVVGELDAKALWGDVCYAAWRCADPGVQYDTTINAWHTCPEDGRINASNPCSEYMFLDDTACNLASINLIKLYDRHERRFDTDRFEHAVDLWTIVLEISVLMAAFPSESIARKSWEFRTLGLGFANIGAMLMQAGVPYDSDEGRAICGMISATMTGRAYRMSALLAAEHGPFAGFKRNREHMLRVIRNHRRAAHGVARGATGAEAYEDLRIRPVPIDHECCREMADRLSGVEHLLKRAGANWDEALELGRKHGYRNAQVTVIAPTGTIGLLMDCDTTGVEPDFALVKFKKLAGGGHFKIANASLRPALESLGYADEQVRDILTFVLGTLTLDTPMPGQDGKFEGAGERGTLSHFLRAKGVPADEIARINDALPGVFELGFALSPWAFSDETLKALEIDPESARADHTFSLLVALGLNRRQINALDERICGSQTVEGAPHLKTEHLPVFDCANTCGRHGVRCISPEGHIRMMAAAQPFITGAISKTINLVNSASVDDIAGAYRLSWELGLKANALYRDGCKLSQPLTSRKEETEAKKDSKPGASGSAADAAELEPVLELVEAATMAKHAADLGEDADDNRVIIVRKPHRRRLKDTRRSVTHKFNIAGHEGYLTVGCYDDGAPGELFVTMAKEGSTIGGLMDTLGTATSVALQYGVPLESMVNKFTHQRFEPAGMTTNPEIPFAKSLIDYIFRWMGMEFVPGYREANAPRRSTKPAKAEVNPDIEPADTAARIEHAGTDKPRITVTAAHAESRTTTAGRLTMSETRSEASMLSVAMKDCQGDAPACEVCGTITVRNGSCYKCLNCGQSMGCS